MADVTDATFQSAVLERSLEVPVVVDFWAEWCGPCRTLGPILEQVIAATDGAVELAKVDVDANPAIAQQFRIQSIPLMVGFKGGRAVNELLGAQPEQEVAAFVAQLLPTEAELELERLLAAGDETSLRRALELDPAGERPVAALAELLATDGRGEEALALLAKVPETAETRRIAALARTGPGAAGDDPSARLSELLELVKGDDDARQEFVDLLELLPEDERGGWRRQLSARLF